MARRNLVRQVEIESPVGSRDPIEYRGVAPDAGLASLEVRELGRADPFGDRAEPDTPGRFGAKLADVSVIRVLGERLLQRLRGGTQPPSWPSRSTVCRMSRAKSSASRASDQAIRHSSMCRAAARDRLRPMQATPVLLNSRLQARRSPSDGRLRGTSTVLLERVAPGPAEARNSSGDPAF
jgi:hypothetical protein